MVGLHRGRDGRHHYGVCGDVAETGVLGEEHRSLNGLSSLRVKKEGARLHGASRIRSVNRKVLDDFAGDLVTLIQYFLVVLILVCDFTARSSKQSFVGQRPG